MIRRADKVVAVSAVLALATGLTGCGVDDDNPIADGGAATTTEETMTGETTTSSARTQYFAGADHVGEKVTITVPVVQDLTEGSVVLDAEAYGDDSLLVLFKGGEREFAEGQSVTATGTVRQFSYDDYADDYGLAESALFDVYADEEFLAADDVTAESATPSS
ncbi:hypothetical protein B0I31_102375 [Saccharothrix carnea]|uniref:Uncharacterized protein n=1 Tax=Saccharothrix carnea TaxID=1280637 RepID=A0A2P8IG17_SACCR|nr:hypothetical protein B0I31_102375 [Saccharothrix carnea]